ncbi:MAG: hypothetical protein ABR597_11035 [Bacteroidales bacterium]
MRSLLLLTFLISAVLFSNSLFSQEVDEYQNKSSNGSISVFLECNSCDKDFIRSSVTFVDYVRDKELADVHIIITTQRSGVSGVNCILFFSGYGRFEEIEHTITYWAPTSSTVYEIREGLVDRIKLGLGPFLANTDLADLFTVSYTGDAEFERVEYTDPWRHWVFQLYGGANFTMEKSQNAFNARYGFYADKVSDDWKIRLRPYFNYNVRNFITEDTIISSRIRRDGFDGYAIRSLSQHWSFGLFSDILSSTFHNMNFSVDVGPGFEYSIYPYKDATRRAITFAYRIGYSYNDYIEETIFDKLTENLFVQRIRASVYYEQTWGSFMTGLQGSHYFHDFNANRVEFFTTMNLRLFKGFSLSLSGNFDLVNDLVSLPKGDLSLEQILLQQRRQATNYQAYGTVGITYTFGSDIQNVVNTRF